MRKIVLICLLLLSGSLLAGPSRTEIETQLYAVHASRQLPRDGIVHASMHWEKRLDRAVVPLLPQVRYTVHFALGELVRPIGEWLSWDDCEYAVLTPLKTLAPQLLNINCYDSFTLGDFHMQRESILVLPKTSRGALPRAGTLYRYDAEQQSLREAVDDCLQSLGAWQVRMDSRDQEDELRPAYKDGVNINTADFFAPLLAHYPQLVHGLRFVAHDGEHYRLSELEFAFLDLIVPLFSAKTPVSIDADFLERFEEDFFVWRQSLEGCQLPAPALEALLSLEAEVEAWLRIGNAELCLQQDKQLTLAGLALDRLAELLIAARDDAELAALLVSIEEQLCSIEEGAA